VALGAATVALRLPRALGSSFWQDEVASARVIREPTVASLLHQVVRTESTPPLWYALGWLAHRAGLSIHDVRLLSVAFDAGIVAVVVLVAAELVPAGLAAAAGVLAATSAELSAHGRELRAYELYALLALVFALALLRAAEHPSRRRLVLLGAAAAAGLLTHYFFAFSFAAGLAWILLEPAAAGRRRPLAAALAAGAVACSPWLPSLLAQIRHDRYSWIGPFDGRLVLETPVRLFSPLLATTWSSVLVLALLLAGGAAALRRGPLARLVAALALVPLPAAALVWLAGFDVYAVRNMLGIAAFSAVLLVLPLASAPRLARTPLAAALAAVAAGAWLWVQQVPDTSFRGIASALVAEGWQPRDAVLVPAVSAFRSPLEWYLPHAPELVGVPVERAVHAPLFAVESAHRAGSAVAAAERRVGAFVVARLRSRPRHGVVLVASRAAAAAGRDDRRADR